MQMAEILSWTVGRGYHTTDSLEPEPANEPPFFARKGEVAHMHRGHLS